MTGVAGRAEWEEQKRHCWEWSWGGGKERLWMAKAEGGTKDEEKLDQPSG